MSRPIFTLIILFITASFILQMITLLSNFNGLHSVYLARIDFVQAGYSNIWNARAILGNAIPSYFTLGVFVLCEGTSTNETICAPPSFGYNYNTTGVLQMVRDNIPPETQALIAKFQQGVFIPSVVLCFILLCYSVFFLFINGGICNYIVIELVSIISLLFCVATFVIQYIVYDQITAQIDGLKKNLFGGLINDFISIQVTRGVSVWLSLAAFILLFLTSVFILFSCCLRRKRAQESYEMDQI